MRIIGGDMRGRKLETPRDEKIRPTSDMVKEAVFNIIQFKIYGKTVLDLFSGTGQMGLEALSRGAERCVFVDSSAEALALTRRNIAKCGVENKAEVIRSNAEDFVKRSVAFDIIFVDPPYDTGLCEKILNRIIEFDLLRINGIIICESRTGQAMPNASTGSFLQREYKYGKTRITVYEKQSEINKDV